MSISYKILGQSAPSATTNTDVYTVPSGTETVLSSITISNRGSSDASYRIAVRSNGETITNKQYIAYNTVVTANDTVALTIGVTLDAEDVITVYSSNDSLSFNIFGSEIV